MRRPKPRFNVATTATRYSAGFSTRRLGCRVLTPLELWIESRYESASSLSSAMSPFRLYPLLISTAAAASLFWFYAVRGHRKTPEQRELERRQRIATIGRITDG